MISSASSSSNRALAAALALACAACAHGARPGAAPIAARRVAILPPENVTGGPLSTGDLPVRMGQALARAGLEVVVGEPVEAFLQRHRVRYTGGIDEGEAAAARDELGVDAVLVTSVELYEGGGVPKVALAARLVSTEAVPTILWVDGVSLVGDDAPGLLDLGVISSFPRLEGQAIARLTRSLAEAVEGRGPRATACEAGDVFAPAAAHRSSHLDLRSRRRTVAILPIGNRTEHHSAGDVLAVELARQLAVVDGLEVVEPGRVRDQLLKYRLVLEGGVSSAVAKTLHEVLGIDLIVSGDIREYREADGAIPAQVWFSLVMLDAATGESVWSSTSYSRGDDGVLFFEQGKVSTAPALTCRMLRNVADGISGKPIRKRITERVLGGDPQLAIAHLLPMSGARAQSLRATTLLTRTNDSLTGRLR